MANNIIAVFAEVPLPGRCLKHLLPFNDEAWLARLYAAMLRDTLDGLEAIPAARYLVVSEATDDRAVLERHVPLPWELVSMHEVDRDAFTILARADAPAASIEPLFEVVNEERAVIGASASGDVWLVGRKPAPALVLPSKESAETIRAGCNNLVTLPDAIIVESQPALEALFDELRRHHERAPRTAIVAMT